MKLITPLDNRFDEAWGSFQRFSRSMQLDVNDTRTSASVRRERSIIDCSSYHLTMFEDANGVSWSSCISIFLLVFSLSPSIESHADLSHRQRFRFVFASWQKRFSIGHIWRAMWFDEEKAFLMTNKRNYDADKWSCRWFLPFFDLFSLLTSDQSLALRMKRLTKKFSRQFHRCTLIRSKREVHACRVLRHRGNSARFNLWRRRR